MKTSPPHHVGGRLSGLWQDMTRTHLSSKSNSVRADQRSLWRNLVRKSLVTPKQELLWAWNCCFYTAVFEEEKTGMRRKWFEPLWMWLGLLLNANQANTTGYPSGWLGALGNAWHTQIRIEMLSKACSLHHRHVFQISFVVRQKKLLSKFSFTGNIFPGYDKKKRRGTEGH